MIQLRHLIRVFTGITLALLPLLSGVALAGERKPAGELWADSLDAVAVNGTALAVLDVGAGEPVILLHGSSADYRTWCGEVEALKARCRVIAYSRRYHHPNQGGGDGRDYSVALHERDLLGLMDALKLHNAHLVGYGTGGNIAAQFAVDHPDRVRSLVLAETAFPALMKDAPRARDYEDERRLVYEQAYQALASDFGELGVPGDRQLGVWWRGGHPDPARGATPARRQCPRAQAAGAVTRSAATADARTTSRYSMSRPVHRRGSQSVAGEGDDG